MTFSSIVLCKILANLSQGHGKLLIQSQVYCMDAHPGGRGVLIGYGKKTDWELKSQAVCGVKLIKG